MISRKMFDLTKQAYVLHEIQAVLAIVLQFDPAFLLLSDYYLTLNPTINPFILFV